MSAAASSTSIVAHCLASLQVAWVLAFHHGMGLLGLWLGLTVGILLSAVLCLLVITFTKWQALADEAAERVKDAMATDSRETDTEAVDTQPHIEAVRLDGYSVVHT